MKCETMMQTKCWCKKNCSRTSASSNISLITERHTYFSGEKNQHFFLRSGFLLSSQDSTVFQQNIKQAMSLTFRTPSTMRIIAPDVTIWRSETGSSQTSPLSQLLPRVSLCAGYIFLTTEFKQQTACGFSSKESMGTSAQSLTLYNMPVFLVNRICRLCIKGTAQPIKATYAQLSK